MRIHSILALAVVASAIAACGGGGGGGTASPATPVVPVAATTVAPTSSPIAVATTSSANAAATLTITLPASSASSNALRRAQNIAPGSQSITLQLIQTNGVTTSGTPQTFGITATSPGCSQANSVITCVVSLAAPVGVDVFTAQTFTSDNRYGHVAQHRRRPHHRRAEYSECRERRARRHDRENVPHVGERLSRHVQHAAAGLIDAALHHRARQSGATRFSIRLTTTRR